MTYYLVWLCLAGAAEAGCRESMAWTHQTYERQECLKIARASRDFPDRFQGMQGFCVSNASRKPL